MEANTPADGVRLLPNGGLIDVHLGTKGVGPRQTSGYGFQRGAVGTSDEDTGLVEPGQFVSGQHETGSERVVCANIRTEAQKRPGHSTICCWPTTKPAAIDQRGGRFCYRQRMPRISYVEPRERPPAAFKPTSTKEALSRASGQFAPQNDQR